MIRSGAIVAKILFIPVSIVSGMVAGFLAKKAFDLAWSRVSSEEAPEPEHLHVKWGELVAALAIQGALFRVIRGVVERASRLGFYRATGAWPGEREPDQV
jgi:Protein of unknown function (DUF4235)